MTEICKIDGTKHKSFVSLTRYIKKLGIPFKEYYDTYLKTDTDGICPCCGGHTPFIKGKYRKFCDVACSAPYIGKNTKPTFTEESKLKLSNALKNRDPKWLDKRVETWTEKYGSVDVVYELRRKFMLELLENMSSSEYNEFVDRMVSAQGSSKSRKYKEYKLGDDIVLIQGYENYVLDVLQRIYNSGDIIVGRSKDRMIRYVDEKSIQRRYFPDIFLPDNVIVEVKSPYTLLNNFENTMLKMKYSYEQGYKPILVIWERAKNKIEMCEKSLIETISSQAWNCPGRFRDYPFIGVGHKQTVSEVLGIQI